MSFVTLKLLPAVMIVFVESFLLYQPTKSYSPVLSVRVGSCEDFSVEFLFTVIEFGSSPYIEKYVISHFVVLSESSVHCATRFKSLLIV